MSVARVPQIMQMEAAECGAACLAMVCAYYEKYIPLSKVRLDCGVSRDGSSALALVKTARSYGFETTSVTCDLAYLRHQAQLPAIIHWGFDHYVVLDGFFGRKAVINDPARGKVKVTMETLDKMFTGVCMSFIPGPHFEKQSKRSSVSRYVMGRVGLMWRSMAFATLCTLMTTIVTIGFTLMHKVFLDSVLSSRQNGWLRLYGAAFLVLVLIQFATSIVEKLAMRRFRTEMTILGSVRFFWYSLCLPLEFFTQRYAADIAGRMDEAEEMSSIIAAWIVPLVVNVLMAVCYVWIMLSTSIPLTIIGLACIFCYRSFCRFLCPLGALYGLMARLALLGVKVDRSRCTDCGACLRVCPMDIRSVGDSECVHCGKCIDVCRFQAISFRAGKLVLRGPELPGKGARQ